MDNRSASLTLEGGVAEDSCPFAAVGDRTSVAAALSFDLSSTEAFLNALNPSASVIQFRLDDMFENV